MKGVSPDTHYVQPLGPSRAKGKCPRCGSGVGRRWWLIRMKVIGAIEGKPFVACSWECAKKELEG